MNAIDFIEGLVTSNQIKNLEADEAYQLYIDSCEGKLSSRGFFKAKFNSRKKKLTTVILEDNYSNEVVDNTPNNTNSDELNTGIYELQNLEPVGVTESNIDITPNNHNFNVNIVTTANSTSINITIPNSLLNQNVKTKENVT